MRDPKQQEPNWLYDTLGVYEESEPPIWFPILFGNDVLTQVVWWGLVIGVLMLTIAAL